MECKRIFRPRGNHGGYLQAGGCYPADSEAFAPSLRMAQRVCGSRPNVPAICARSSLQ